MLTRDSELANSLDPTKRRRTPSMANPATSQDSPEFDPELWRQIVAERSIQRVINDYGRGIDESDFERVRDCFFADATITYGTRDAMPLDVAIDWLSRMTPALPGLSHYFGVPIVDFDSDGLRATCQTWCINVNQYPRGMHGEEKQTASGLLYDDVFECREGVWKIAARRNSGEWNLEVDGNSRLPAPSETSV